MSALTIPAPAALIDRTTVVRERRFAYEQFADVMLEVCERHLTGTILIDLNQGHVASFRIREEQRIDFDTDVT